MVYNNQGKSRGMAVVTFTRPGDAAVARTKYNGKIVDGREFSFICDLSMSLPVLRLYGRGHEDQVLLGSSKWRDGSLTT